MARHDSDKTLTLRRDATSILVKDRPCVIVVEGASIGKQVRLSVDEMIVGRSKK